MEAGPCFPTDREHHVLRVVHERGLLRARPSLSLSMDADRGAAHCNIKGMCQRPLPLVPASDIEPYIPHGMQPLWRALNFGVCFGKSYREIFAKTPLKKRLQWSQTLLFPPFWFF